MPMLRKTKANITMWNLLTSFINHRKAPLNVIAGMEVPMSFTLEELVRFFTTKRFPLTITCDDIDLPPKEIKRNKALYLTITYMNKFMPMTLVDN